MTLTVTYSTDFITKDNLAFILSKRDRSVSASSIIRELIAAEAARLKKKELKDKAA